MTAIRSFRRALRPAAVSAALLAATLLLGTGHAARAADAFTPPALWVDNYGYNAGGWRVELHPRLLADVNGDRRVDIVGFGDAGAYVSLNTGFSFAQPVLWVNNYGASPAAGGWDINKHPRFVVDVNGDGRADVVGFGDAGVYVSLSNGSSFSQPALWVSNYGYVAGGWRVDRHPRFVIDVNRDRFADIVGFGDAGVYVSLGNGSSFSQPALWVDNYGYVAGGWRVDRHPRFVADVNRDRFADIVGFGDAGAYVSLGNGSSFSQPSLWVGNYGYLAGGWRVDRHPRFLADVNNDKRADIVGFGEAGAYVSLGNGVSFSQPSLWVANFGAAPAAGGWDVAKHPRFLADVTGDGRADIVGFGDAGAYVSRAVRFQFTFPTLWVDNYGYNAGGWRVERHPRLLGNVNRDGKADIVGFGDAGAYVSLSRATR